MSKSGMRTSAAAWQPTSQAASKSIFTARPFPEIVQREQETAGNGETAAQPVKRRGIIENINRSMSKNFIPAASNVGIVGVQAKLTIGEPGDQYEQEADRVAAEVVQKMNAPAAPGITAPPRMDGFDKTMQRKPVIPIVASRESPGVEMPVMRKNGLTASHVPDVQADFERQLNQARGGGGALDEAFRAKIEPAMGADFSRVRVHTDSRADEMSQSIQAKAFTTGQDVFFRQGAYEPGSRDGQELLAHELTHVVQQNGGAVQQSGILEEGKQLQGKFTTDGMSAPIQMARETGENRTGMPDQLKAGLEKISGLDMSSVRVHYNSAKPAQLNALAYTQGQDIEVGPGQERHLPHEGWHVVQQMQGRVQPTMQAKGAAINDNLELEREADLMGAKAVSISNHTSVQLQSLKNASRTSLSTLQLATVFKFANCKKEFQAKADQIIKALNAHPSIIDYVGDRTCIITIQEQEVPADITDKGRFVDVNLASWYFEKYSIGYILGMLSHEFGIHPVPEHQVDDLDEIEKNFSGRELETGVKKRNLLGLTKEDHTVNTNRSKQADHILGAVMDLPRSNVYKNVVIEMAQAMLQKGSGITPDEVTNLIDCFLMDVSSILAGDDDRKKAAQNIGTIADIYNLYKQNLAQALPKDSPVLKLLPPDKDRMNILADFAKVGLNFVKGAKDSIDPEYQAYQPNEIQNQHLEMQGREIVWIDPNGRCVFGALGHLQGQSAEDIVELVLARLEVAKTGLQHANLAQLIVNAGQNIDNVIDCIQSGRWNDPQVGDIILEVAATALNLSVTVLLPDGTMYAINGGGALIVKVDNPLEHYHATRERSE
ncbi:hypothetical protein NIES4074_36060 [Cylindrospermum sp. NIES-4074]|nr:hypothetical protein NIES4074_36060 [Cylindrospermum sp. NIES-4074]